MRAALIDAIKKSRYICKNKNECEKAFSLTQIFISENSDMKIQVATDTIIETYNPSDFFKTGLKAVKIPRKSNVAEIVLTASCSHEGSDEEMQDFCNQKILSIYLAYPKFIKSVLNP